MRIRFIPLLLAAMVLMALPAAAQDAECTASDEPLADTEFYTALSANEVEFQADAYWEVVKSKDDTVLVRFGKDQSDALVAVVALECRCLVPTVCVENSCEVTGAGTGNAKCRGGCYEADGDACVSCRFFETTTTEP